MKKVTVYDLFLLTAIILNIGSRNVFTSITLLCAGALELMDTIPKIIKLIKGERHGGK